LRTIDRGVTLYEANAVYDRGVCFRLAALPKAQQSIGCVSDVAQHGLVFVAHVMVDTAAVDAFNAHEGHATAVPLDRHEIEIIFLMCCKLSMRLLVAVRSEAWMEVRHYCG